MSEEFKRGDFVIEDHSPGVILACGSKTYDIVWQGGSTSRYRYGVRDVRVVTAEEIDKYGLHVRALLIKDAASAREERRTPVRKRPHGMRIKRGQVWP